MDEFKHHWATKGIALFLAVGLLWGGQSIFSQETNLEGLFNWAIKNYLEGKYREVIKDLELLLSYCSEDHKQLKGKIHLLLGAVYEQLGDIDKARQNYQLSFELVQNPAIDEIDLTSLQEYQRIIKKNPQPLQREIIEKPITRPKRKKRISPLYMVAGAALIVGGVIAFVLSKKGQEGEIEVVPDYDTRQMGIEWIQVPPGEFLMGDNFHEGENDEQPVHAVMLGEYYISKYEVTFEQFDKYCNETGLRSSEDNWGRENHPVINLTQSGASGFCHWLSRKTGKNIHLPTEAQWEKAARGTDQRRYPWGNSPPDCTKANCNNCYNQTRPVGFHPTGVSPYGVHDMAGNVAEICLDQYSQSFYYNSPYNNPLNTQMPPPSIAPSYVIRGGSWSADDFMGYRAADRGRIHPAFIRNTLGFRLVMER